MSTLLSHLEKNSCTDDEIDHINKLFPKCKPRVNSISPSSHSVSLNKEESNHCVYSSKKSPCSLDHCGSYENNVATSNLNDRQYVECDGKRTHLCHTLGPCDENVNCCPQSGESGVYHSNLNRHRTSNEHGKQCCFVDSLYNNDLSANNTLDGSNNIIISDTGIHCLKPSGGSSEKKGKMTQSCNDVAHLSENKNFILSEQNQGVASSYGVEGGTQQKEGSGVINALEDISGQCVKIPKSQYRGQYHQYPMRDEENEGHIHHVYEQSSGPNSICGSGSSTGNHVRNMTRASNRSSSKAGHSHHYHMHHHGALHHRKEQKDSSESCQQQLGSSYTSRDVGCGLNHSSSFVLERNGERRDGIIQLSQSPSSPSILSLGRERIVDKESLYRSCEEGLRANKRSMRSEEHREEYRAQSSQQEPCCMSDKCVQPDNTGGLNYGGKVLYHNGNPFADCVLSGNRNTSGSFVNDKDGMISPKCDQSIKCSSSRVPEQFCAGSCPTMSSSKSNVLRDSKIEIAGGREIFCQSRTRMGRRARGGSSSTSSSSEMMADLASSVSLSGTSCGHGKGMKVIGIGGKCNATGGSGLIHGSHKSRRKSSNTASTSHFPHGKSIGPVHCDEGSKSPESSSSTSLSACKPHSSRRRNYPVNSNKAASSSSSNGVANSCGSRACRACRHCHHPTMPQQQKLKSPCGNSEEGCYEMQKDNRKGIHTSDEGELKPQGIGKQSNDMVEARREADRMVPSCNAIKIKETVFDSEIICIEKEIALNDKMNSSKSVNKGYATNDCKIESQKSNHSLNFQASAASELVAPQPSSMYNDVDISKKQLMQKCARRNSLHHFPDKHHLRDGPSCKTSKSFHFGQSQLQLLQVLMKDDEMKVVECQTGSRSEASNAHDSKHVKNLLLNSSPCPSTKGGTTSPSGYETDDALGLNPKAQKLLRKPEQWISPENVRNRLIGNLPIAQYEESPKRYGVKQPTQAMPSQLDLIDISLTTGGGGTKSELNDKTPSEKQILNPLPATATTTSSSSSSSLDNTYTNASSVSSCSSHNFKSLTGNAQLGKEHSPCHPTRTLPGFPQRVIANDESPRVLESTLNCTDTSYLRNGQVSDGLSGATYKEDKLVNGNPISNLSENNELNGAESDVLDGRSNSCVTRVEQSSQTRIIDFENEGLSSEIAESSSKPLANDYLFEFSETRKVLEEFFSAASSDKEVTIMEIDDAQNAVEDGSRGKCNSEFDDLNYVLRRQAGNSYVGQRLATDGGNLGLGCQGSPQKNSKAVGSSVDKEIDQEKDSSPRLISFQELSLSPHVSTCSKGSKCKAQSKGGSCRMQKSPRSFSVSQPHSPSLPNHPRDFNDNDIDGETRSTNSDTDLKNPHVPIAMGQRSCDYILSPETTDCDSNEYESELSLEYEGSPSLACGVEASIGVVNDYLSSENNSENEQVVTGEKDGTTVVPFHSSKRKYMTSAVTSNSNSSTCNTASAAVSSMTVIHSDIYDGENDERDIESKNEASHGELSGCVLPQQQQQAQQKLHSGPVFSQDSHEISAENRKNNAGTNELGSGLDNFECKEENVEKIGGTAGPGSPYCSDCNSTMLLMRKQISEIEDEIKSRASIHNSHHDHHHAQQHGRQQQEEIMNMICDFDVTHEPWSNVCGRDPTCTNELDFFDDANKAGKGFSLGYDCMKGDTTNDSGRNDVSLVDATTFSPSLCNESQKKVEKNSSFNSKDPELEALDPMRPTPPPSPAPGSILSRCTHPSSSQVMNGSKNSSKSPMLPCGPIGQTGIQMRESTTEVISSMSCPMPGVDAIITVPSPPVKTDTNPFESSGIGGSGEGGMMRDCSESVHSRYKTQCEQQDKDLLSSHQEIMISSSYPNEPINFNACGGTDDSKREMRAPIDHSMESHQSSSSQCENLIHDSPVWIPRKQSYPEPSPTSDTDPLLQNNQFDDAQEQDEDADTDQETDRLLGRSRKEDDYGFYDSKEWKKVKSRSFLPAISKGVSLVKAAASSSAHSSLFSSSLSSSTTNSNGYRIQGGSNGVLSNNSVHLHGSIIDSHHGTTNDSSTSTVEPSLTHTGGATSSSSSSSSSTCAPLISSTPAVSLPLNSNTSAFNDPLNELPSHSAPPHCAKSKKDKDLSKKKRGKEGMDPSVLIEGVLFRARYLGSTQLTCEGQPTKSTRMTQAEEAVSRIKGEGVQSPDSDHVCQQEGEIATALVCEANSHCSLMESNGEIDGSGDVGGTSTVHDASCAPFDEYMCHEDFESCCDGESMDEEEGRVISNDNEAYRKVELPCSGSTTPSIDNDREYRRSLSPESLKHDGSTSHLSRRLQVSSSGGGCGGGSVGARTSSVGSASADNSCDAGASATHNAFHIAPPCGSALPGTMFRLRFIGSLEVEEEVGIGKRRRKRPKKAMVEEVVVKLKAPEGETQPSTEVDLFISTEKIMVLNTDLKEIMMDHALRTISYIADIGDLVVLMARRRPIPSDESDDSKVPSPPKMICHVFESEEAQYIAQSIGQAFQVAYMEFLKANGIEDHSFVREMDYQEVLNSQEIFGDELQMFAKKELQKEVVVPKSKGEILGVVIVESGWGSMLPTVVIANLAPGGAAARCGQLNIGDQIIAINGVSLVGLPLSTCQTYIKNSKQQTVVKLTVVPCPPVVEVKIKRPDTKYQLGFSVQNGVICSLLRGGIAERGGVRVGHRIIEINNQSVVAVPHEKIVNLLATSVGEINMKTMPTSMFRLLTGQETPLHI